MEFSIYKDLGSLAFVRCISPIPGTDIHAEGAGLYLGNAIEKCRSEVIERSFILNSLIAKDIIGIAAHPNKSGAEYYAHNEALETLLLEKLAKGHSFNSLRFTFGKLQFLVGLVEDRFAVFTIFEHQKTKIAALALSKNPISALVKSIGEYRNIKIYNPSRSELSTYSRVGKILGNASNIRIRKGFFNILENSLKCPVTEKIKSHYVAYFTKESI